MNSIDWLRYYQNNPKNWTDPEWHVPSPLDPKTKRALAHSLSHFQLGESGGGNFLLAQAQKQAPDDAAYHEALELFVAEEKAHARLLEQLVHHFGGGTIKRHWTHALFRLARRALGLNFELQVLVIAELVGTAYYRLLHRRSRDPVLEQACDRILRDDEATLAVVRYILENPIRAGLAKELGEWPSAGSHVYTWAQLLSAWDDRQT